MENLETVVSVYFSEVQDPRRDYSVEYPLEEIFLLALCTILTVGQTISDRVLFGENRLEFLRQFYPYKDGIAQYHTLRRVFMALDPEVFETCFVQWAKTLYKHNGDEHIAIDGKMARRSFGKNQKALTMVSAYASNAGLVLAQIRVEDKTNEIGAIPYLISVLDIKGNVISIGAMGCQKSIAKEIKDREGEYVLALKGNHKTLNREVAEVFEGKRISRYTDLEESLYQTLDKGHGRIEERKYRVIGVENLPINVQEWEGIRSIVEVHSIGKDKQGRSEEKRYFISSLAPNATKISESIRAHWGIENSLHWVLDTAFNEDQSRISSGNAPENLSIIRKVAINMVKKSPRKLSVKRFLYQASLNPQALKHIIAVY